MHEKNTVYFIEFIIEKSTTLNRIEIHTFVKVTFIAITFCGKKGTANIK